MCLNIAKHPRQKTKQIEIKDDQTSKNYEHVRHNLTFSFLADRGGGLAAGSLSEIISQSLRIIETDRSVLGASSACFVSVETVEHAYSAAIQDDTGRASRCVLEIHKYLLTPP